MNTTPHRSVFRSAATACALFLPVLAFGFGDPFSYSTGNLQTTSSGKWFSWLNNSQISVDAFKRAVIGSTRNDSMARLLRPLDGGGNIQSWAEDAIYLRFNLEVSSVPAAGNGEYFACFSDMAGNRRGRIFIQRSSATTFQIGASFASILPQVLTSNLSINQSHRIVVKLNRLNKQVTIWVDPASEASSSITSTDLSSQFSYDVVLLRQSLQYGGVGSLMVDNLLVGAAFNEVAAPIFDITDPAWGSTPAIADDNLSDGPGLRQAITALKNSGQPGILLFPTGTYILDEVGAVKVPYDGNNYFNAGVLDGLGNASVVEGSGSTLLMKNSVAPASGYSPSYVKVTPLFLANCAGLTLKNLRFSYERPSVSTGTVGTVTPRTPPENYTREWRFPVTVDGLPLSLGDNNWAVDGVCDMDAATGLPLMNLSARDNSDKNYIDWSLANSGGVSTYTLTVRTNTSDVDRLKHLDLTMAQIAGSKAVLHHPSGGTTSGLYGPPTVAAYKCSNVILRDVEINGNVGMGFKASECTSLAFKRVDLVPLPGQLLSTAKDGLFLSLCKGQITFDDCLLQATGDDSINVHANKFLVISGTIPTSAPFVVNGVAGDGTFSGPTPVAGDTFQFLQKGDNLNAPYPSGSTPFVGTVVSATRSNNTLIITFNALPAGLKATDYMFKTNGAPTVSVTNCTFSGGIARGLVLSTEGITVSDSLFEDIAFNGIYFVADPARSGAQAPGSQNVLINNCEFSGCGAAPIGTLSSSSNPPARPSEAGMFQNFTITNNIIAPESSAGINAKRLARRTTGGTNESFRSAYMQSALYLPSLGGTNLIQNNQLGGTNPDTGFNPAVYLNHSLGLSLLNNVAPGMNWRRCVLYRPVPTHYDPVPSFGSTPTSGAVDYLVFADQEAVNTSGNPTTSDSDLFGYARVLGDIQ
jgi:hypothetical protein